MLVGRKIGLVQFVDKVGIFVRLEDVQSEPGQAILLKPAHAINYQLGLTKNSLSFCVD